MLCNRQIAKCIGIAIALAILLAASATAQAATFYMLHSGYEWNYFNFGSNNAWYTNWYGSGNAPGTADTVYVGLNGTVNVNSAAGANLLYVGFTGGTNPGTGTVNIASNTYTVATAAYLGSSTNGGTITQSGGLAKIPTLTFGGATSGWAGGAYNLNGGTLSLGAGGIVQGAYGTASLVIAGGTLQLTTNSAVNMTLKSGGTNTIDTQNYNITYSGILSDWGYPGGNLAKAGTGTLVLTGANSYTGATIVNAGTLVLDYSTNSSVLSSTSPLTLAGGTLKLLGNSSGTTAQAMGNLTVGAAAASPWPPMEGWARPSILALFRP